MIAFAFTTYSREKGLNFQVVRSQNIMLDQVSNPPKRVLQGNSLNYRFKAYNKQNSLLLAQNKKLSFILEQSPKAAGS